MILGFVTVKFFPTLFFSSGFDYEWLNIFITNTKRSFNILIFSSNYWSSYFISKISLIWLNLLVFISSICQVVISNVRCKSFIEIFLPILTRALFSAHQTSHITKFAAMTGSCCCITVSISLVF